MSKKSEKMLAYHRLQMLEFAEALGNVSEACRKMGISRTQFSEYKQRYREQGLEGSKTYRPLTSSIRRRPHLKWLSRSLFL